MHHCKHQTLALGVHVHFELVRHLSLSSEQADIGPFCNLLHSPSDLLQSWLGLLHSPMETWCCPVVTAVTARRRRGPRSDSQRQGALLFCSFVKCKSYTIVNFDVLSGLNIIEYAVVTIA